MRRFHNLPVPRLEIQRVCCIPDRYRVHDTISILNVLNGGHALAHKRRIRELKLSMLVELSETPGRVDVCNLVSVRFAFTS